MLCAWCVHPLRSNAARPYSGGAVATANEQASAAGRAALEAGGNAVDAAVAAAFASAVVNPSNSGLGGGGFALVSDVERGLAALDFREVAPRAAHRDLFVREGAVVPSLATDGALAVAVPGAVKGYLALHERYGVLPRATVLAPAIRLARRGFVVTPKYRSAARLRERCLRADPEASRIFLRPRADGTPAAPELGTLVRQPELARTLEAAAARGEAAFYSGPIADALVRTVKDAGGLLTSEDLARYRVVWRAPLRGSYRGHPIATMPPPSGGGLILLQVLRLLELGGPRGPAHRDVATLHLFVEALRRTAVDRARAVGDPDFVDVPVAELLSDAHLAALRASIDPRRATPSSALAAEAATPPDAAPPSDAGSSAEFKNTMHVSVIDRRGNAVALTSTINYAFGACLVARGTGVLLNDEMGDFAAQPGVPNVYGLVSGEANAVAPGKRPLSSMSPTIVFQREAPTRAMLAVGSPGGSTIPSTVLQVISAVIDARLDVGRAVALGRLHHQWLPDEVRLERTTLEPATAAALEALGHKLTVTDGWGDAEAVLVDPSSGLRTAASDPRNEGAPAGHD